MSEQEAQNSDTLTPIRAHNAPLTAEQRAQAQSVFIASLRTDGNVTGACVKAGISRDTAYKWRAKYKAFGEVWDDAQKRFNDIILGAIVQRAITGVEEPVVSVGRVVEDANGNPLMTRRYSDNLLSLLAKARMPEFRDKQQIEHSGSVTMEATWGSAPMPQRQEEEA